MSSPVYPVQGAGLGLRRSLMDALSERAPDSIGFYEIAPENWIGVGGRFGKALRAFTERHPFVTHGLSLSLGGPAPLDEAFLHRLRQFLDEHGIPTYTEHLSYCSDDGHLYDLMPSPSPRMPCGTSRHASGGPRKYSSAGSPWKTSPTMPPRARRWRRSSS